MPSSPDKFQPEDGDGSFPPHTTQLHIPKNHGLYFIHLYFREPSSIVSELNALPLPALEIQTSPVNDYISCFHQPNQLLGSKITPYLKVHIHLH